MNNKQLLPYLILLIASLLSACRGPEAKDASASSASVTPVAAGEKYAIDTKQSIVTWFGSNALSKGSHTGYAYLSKGVLMMDKGQLASGTIEVDMNTLADEKHESENELIRHLKSADFFEVEKFPFSGFAITQVAPASDSTINVTGILTMKGVSQPVTFPATIEVKDEIVYANGKLSIDRTLWNVVYKSGKFGIVLADGLISDIILFDVKIVARK